MDGGWMTLILLFTVYYGWLHMNMCLSSTHIHRQMVLLWDSLHGYILLWHWIYIHEWIPKNPGFHCYILYSSVGDAYIQHHCFEEKNDTTSFVFIHMDIIFFFYYIKFYQMPLKEFIIVSSELLSVSILLHVGYPYVFTYSDISE